MAALPKVRPISDLRIRGAEVLEGLSEGPVILAHRGHAAAVLVSLDTWNNLVERLEDAEDALDVAEARQAPGTTTTLEEYMAMRGESVPA